MDLSQDSGQCRVDVGSDGVLRVGRTIATERNRPGVNRSTIDSSFANSRLEPSVRHTMPGISGPGGGEHPQGSGSRPVCGRNRETSRNPGRRLVIPQISSTLTSTRTVTANHVFSRDVYAFPSQNHSLSLSERGGESPGIKWTSLVSSGNLLAPRLESRRRLRA
jgi:hypothetical protein